MEDDTYQNGPTRVHGSDTEGTGSENGASYVESLNSSNVSIPSALSGVSAGRAVHNSGASHGSSSDGEFVRFEQDELSEIPAELLADYGNQMAFDVLNQVTNGEGRGNSLLTNGNRSDQEQRQYNTTVASQPFEDVSTPSTDELASPISNYMEQSFIAEHDPTLDPAQQSESNQLRDPPFHETSHNINYSGSEFDPLAGRTTVAPHSDIADVHFDSNPSHFDQDYDSDVHLNMDDSIIIQPDEEDDERDRPLAAAAFADTDRPEVTSAEISFKTASTDSEIEPVMEPVPNVYEKPTETSPGREFMFSARDGHENKHEMSHNSNSKQWEQELIDQAALSDSNHEKVVDWNSDDTQQQEISPEHHVVETAAALPKNDMEKDDESDHDDTLASLPSESNVHGDADVQSLGDELPESSSITGMRDFAANGAAEDEEALIHARAGRPLVIPQEAIAASAAAAVSGAALVAHAATGDRTEGKKSAQFAESAKDVDYAAPALGTSNPHEEEPPIPSNWPIRPPTPPKSLENSEDEGEKPSAVDLGPPPPSHYLSQHRTSSSGLHSILKRHEDKAWITSCTNPVVLDLVYWRDPKRSGIALAVSLVILYLFAQFTVLSVFAYVALAALGAAIGFRVFKIVEARFKNTDGSNPFKPYLEQEVVVPQEKLHAQVELFVEHAQNAFKCLRHLFLVENLVDSVKFGLLLYTLTYIGAWFSGLTLAFFFIVGLFSVPKIYELNKEPIDNYVAIAQEHIEKIQHAIEDKLPFLKKQVDAEKKEH